MTDLATNVLAYDDDLDILHRYLPDASVNLCRQSMKEVPWTLSRSSRCLAIRFAWR